MWRYAAVAALFAMASARGRSTTNTLVGRALSDDSEEGTCADCVQRSDATLRLITHGTKGDSFWELWSATAAQAAADSGVSLEFHAFYDDFDSATMASEVAALAWAGE